MFQIRYSVIIPQLTFHGPVRVTLIIFPTVSLNFGRFQGKLPAKLQITSLGNTTLFAQF